MEWFPACDAFFSHLWLLVSYAQHCFLIRVVIGFS